MLVCESGVTEILRKTGQRGLYLEGVASKGAEIWTRQCSTSCPLRLLDVVHSSPTDGWDNVCVEVRKGLCKSMEGW